MASFGFGPLSFFHGSRRARSVQLSKGPRRKPTSLGFESLEPRQMLAADMAEVIGTVRLDVQGDGNPANDTVVAGASVALYKDNGNGVLDAGDALAKSPTTTDILGRYRLSGLTAGKYFAKVTLPAGMQSLAGGDVREINVTAADAQGSVGILIDGFTTMQKVEAQPPLPDSHGSPLVDPAVLGNERDMYVELTAGTDIFSSVSLISGGGLLRLASDTTVTGNAKIVWDGIDGSATNIDHTGLGGVDFTDFEGNRMTGLRLAVGADHANSIVKLKIYTGATRWTEFVTTVPETPGGAATSQVVFNFQGSPSNVAGGGADFSNVGAVELTFQGVSAVDGQVSVVDIIGFTTKTADFTAYSKLSLGDRVWRDSNNNSKLDAGEAGIGGVKVNLYVDADNSNTYTPGDTFVDSTTTDGTGRYLFSDLLAGKYVVQVDAVNFQAGQALAGLNSSTGAAVDPDNDVDGDDNGTALAGAGVVSQAVTLTGLGEPTNDGDGANSNLTVDFGFYGFDLVLDKEVDKESASPNERLTYTVTVTNDGPSTAFNTQFVDTLPAGVTYVSHTASKTSGVSLTYSNGKVSGTLGNLADGEVVVITILADVKASATGVLVNQAHVEADNEINLANNDDEVPTPITPKIDLQIDKIDSKDPVKPGETFTYTITAKNNGPSNATGVKVIDVLPSQVTFQSASRPSTSTTPGTLTFDIGNLAAGAQVQFTITVKVNAGVQGTFVNHTEVSGNELEITYANNQDDEPTTVQIEPASVEGYVYVDKDNDGVFDAGEKPIANVTMTLTGNDFTGAAVTRTTTTNAAGHYKFDNLMPGQYEVKETHPAQYKDGKDTVGQTFNSLGVLTAPTAFNALDLNDTDQFDADAIQNLTLDSGYAAKDFNFGELATGTTKRDLVRRMLRS